MKSTRYSCPNLIKLEYSQQIIEKYSNTKFYGSPFSRSRVVPCGRVDGQTDMTMLTVAFRNSANAPKISWKYVLETTAVK
jgi:hypothetical protein